ncbi:patatin-like phospholipase domain-containing protein 4 [Eucyclogobius newberryi]|uniref:patatin-like phospholipase domain-containing protein 4 n=1 Tax=Eucyclogobius newberryi TaxID=166745 RepID=UPI003B5B1DD0
MAPGITNCQFRETPVPISFSGSGFMATYQLGVAQCLLNYAPWILKTAPCVFGASAGSLVAAAVVCEIDFVCIRDEMLHFAKQVKAFRLGPFNPSINVFHWLEHLLQKYVSDDAHKLACGRLAVAMTRLEDGKHIVITEYHSKEDIVQALLCSCFVPGYCGMTPPSFKGMCYLDGGFTGMQPVHPQCPTLTVSPFSGDMDICPADAPCLWEMVVAGTALKANGANCGRVINALYPVTLESLEEAFDSGYNDAILFLLRNELAPSLNVSHEKTHLKTTKRDAAGDQNNLTNFTDSTMTQATGSKDDPIRKLSAMPLDFLENVLLRNIMTNETMVRVSEKLFTFLLLPLLLVVFTGAQSWNRLQFWLRDSPRWMFWIWAGFRHFTGFFYDICISTIRKNIYERVKNIMMLLMWLNVYVEMEGPPRAGQHCGPTAPPVRRETKQPIKSAHERKEHN